MKQNLISHCQEGKSDKVYMYCVRRNADSTYTVVGKWGRRGQTSLTTQVKGVFKIEADAMAEMQRLHRDRIRKKDYVDIEGAHYDGPLTVADKAISKNLEGRGTDEFGKTLDIAAGQRYSITAPGSRKRFVNGPASIVLKAGEDASKGMCDCGNDTFESVVDKDAKRLMVCASCKKVWGLNGKSVKNMEYDEDVVICLNNSGMEDKFDESIEYISEKHDDLGMIYVYDKFGQKQECFMDRFKIPSPFKSMELAD